jgi:hypothetical protein
MMKNANDRYGHFGKLRRLIGEPMKKNLFLFALAVVFSFVAAGCATRASVNTPHHSVSAGVSAG